MLAVSFGVSVTGASGWFNWLAADDTVGAFGDSAVVPAVVRVVVDCNQVTAVAAHGSRYDNRLIRLRCLHVEQCCMYLHNRILSCCI